MPEMFYSPTRKKFLNIGTATDANSVGELATSSNVYHTLGANDRIYIDANSTYNLVTDGVLKLDIINDRDNAKGIYLKFDGSTSPGNYQRALLVEHINNLLTSETVYAVRADMYFSGSSGGTAYNFYATNDDSAGVLTSKTAYYAGDNFTYAFYSTSGNILCDNATSFQFGGATSKSGGSTVYAGFGDSDATDVSTARLSIIGYATASNYSTTSLSFHQINGNSESSDRTAALISGTGATTNDGRLIFYTTNAGSMQPAMLINENQSVVIAPQGSDLSSYISSSIPLLVQAPSGTGDADLIVFGKVSGWSTTTLGQFYDDASNYGFYIAGSGGEKLRINSSNNTWTIPITATGRLYIDATSTAHTNSNGVIDLDMKAGAAYLTAVNINLDGQGNHAPSALSVYLTPGAISGTENAYGISVSCYNTSVNTTPGPDDGVVAYNAYTDGNETGGWIVGFRASSAFTHGVYSDSPITISNNATLSATSNAVSLGSADLSAGNTMLAIQTEGSGCIGTGTPTQDRTIAMQINGTTYYLLASTSAT